MGLVLVVYAIRNTNFAWQTFSCKMPLWFETMLVRRAYQPVVQVCRAEQLLTKSWHPYYPFFMILFELNLSELVQYGKSLVLLGALWMHCWSISASCFIQFVYLDTAVWSKHEAVGSTTTFNSNLLSPSELMQEHRCALQWGRGTGKSALKYFFFQDISVTITLSHFGVTAAALVTVLFASCRG